MAFSPAAFGGAFALGLTLGDYRFQVISHQRTIASGMVEERFVVDAFYQGNPHNWNPGSNRETIWFGGKESQDVYNDQGTLTGTKRGADYRATLNFKLYERAEAARLGVRMGTLDVDVIKAATDTARAVLQTHSLDTAITKLVGL